MLRTVSNLTIH